MPALFSCSEVCCLQTDSPLWRQQSSRGNDSKTDFGKANCGWVMKYSWSPREVFKSYYICFGKAVRYMSGSGRIAGVLAGVLLTLSSHHFRKDKTDDPIFSPFKKTKYMLKWERYLTGIPCWAIEVRNVWTVWLASHLLIGQNMLWAGHSFI